MDTITSAWKGHEGFAQWLVNRKVPETVVDLGVDTGFSTFNWATPRIGHVYGIDSFMGDEHAGIKETYDYVHNMRSQLGLDDRITFIKGMFAEVALTWDKPIDILHIDGFHTYEAVKMDYDTWSPFVKDDGIILFHDTCVFYPGFGVYKFFEELAQAKSGKTLNFTHSYGLGIVTENAQLLEDIKTKWF